MKRSEFNWDSIPVKMITMTQPALGAQFNVAETTVPTDKRWRFVGAYLLVAVSGAANWSPLCAFDDGTATHAIWSDYANILAATPVNIVIGPYAYRYVTAGTVNYLPTFNGLELPPGYAFRVTGVTADDRWATSYFFYKEAPA